MQNNLLCRLAGARRWGNRGVVAGLILVTAVLRGWGQCPPTDMPHRRAPGRSGSAAAAGRSRQPPLEPCTGAFVIARIGKEAVTARDIMAEVGRAIEQSGAKMSEEEFRRQREQLTEQVSEGLRRIIARRRGGDTSPLTRSEKVQRQIIRGLLRKRIQTLLVYADVKRSVPEEAFAEVEKQVDGKFDTELIPRLMERTGTKYRDELQAALEARASSIERERCHFLQQTLAQQWIHQNVEFDEEITHAEMLEYYREHAEEFDRPAQIIWEHLAVNFSNHPSTAEARAKIARLGNQVLAGTPLEEVARRHSDGVAAADGGRRVWPSDDLLSEQLEAAIQGLPPGKLSRIIRDWRGLHIVRVVERRPAGRVPFEKAQDEIHRKIKSRRVNRQIEEYVAELNRRTPIWSVFQEEPQVAGTPRRAR